MANTVSTKNLRDNRTYMEALIGSGRENEMRRRVSVDNFDCGLEQRNVRAEPEEFLKVKVGGLNSQVEIPIKEMCWLSRCLADKIKPIKEQLQDPWFEFIEPVAVSEEHQRVKVWVSLEEVPLCLWHPSFFSFIGNTWGSLIEIDKSTVANECFEFARMLVMVERVSDIPSSISVLVNSCSSEEDNPSHRNNLGQWEDLWASESEPNIGIESTNNQDSDKINGSGINVEMEGVEEATPNLPNENDTLESQGLDCSTKRGPHVGTSVDPNPQSVGLHEVPIVNMAFPDSDSSSFCLRNENGLLISGRGIPTFGQSSKSKPKRKNNRRCRFCTGVRITSPWNWPCRNTSPSLSNSMELRKKDQFSLSGQAVPVGEVDIGAKTSSPSGPSVDFAGTSQYKVTEATNTLEAACETQGPNLSQIKALYLNSSEGKAKGFDSLCGLINLYAPNDGSAKKAVFDELELLISSHNIQWLIGGDFNTVKSPEEKLGVSFNHSAMKALADFIDNTSLIDLPLVGSKFTWSNLRESATMCRLDRILVSPEILELLPGLTLQALPKSISDHNPILAYVEKYKSGPRPFKFFNHWMEDDGFNELITNSLTKLRGSGINFIIKKLM
ncbi:hypothetical protein V6N13_074872 [Hibiscus sabdariffa]